MNRLNLITHVIEAGVFAAVCRVASVVEAEDLSAGVTLERQEICAVVTKFSMTEGSRGTVRMRESAPHTIDGVKCNIGHSRVAKPCSCTLSTSLQLHSSLEIHVSHARQQRSKPFKQTTWPDQSPQCQISTWEVSWT